jgi:hypothetical protein
MVTELVQQSRSVFRNVMPGWEVSWRIQGKARFENCWALKTRIGDFASIEKRKRDHGKPSLSLRALYGRTS